MTIATLLANTLRAAELQDAAATERRLALRTPERRRRAQLRRCQAFGRVKVWMP